MTETKILPAVDMGHIVAFTILDLARNALNIQETSSTTVSVSHQRCHVTFNTPTLPTDEQIKQIKKELLLAGVQNKMLPGVDGSIGLLIPWRKIGMALVVGVSTTEGSCTIEAVFGDKALDMLATAKFTD